MADIIEQDPSTTPHMPEEQMHCTCVSKWEHKYFACNLNRRRESAIRLDGTQDRHETKWDKVWEEGSTNWEKRTSALESMMRSRCSRETFNIKQLSEGVHTNDLWHALHHPTMVLIRFLKANYKGEEEYVQSNRPKPSSELDSVFSQPNKGAELASEEEIGARLGITTKVIDKLLRPGVAHHTFQEQEKATLLMLKWDNGKVDDILFPESGTWQRLSRRLRTAFDSVESGGRAIRKGISEIWGRAGGWS